MKNEHKIDYVSIHEDREKVKQSFENIGGALERGSRPARAGSQQFASFGCFDIFFCFWDIFPTTLNFFWDPRQYISHSSLSLDFSFVFQSFSLTFWFVLGGS